MTLFPREITQQGRYGLSSQDTYILGPALPWTTYETSTLLSLETAHLLIKTEQSISMALSAKNTFPTVADQIWLLSTEKDDLV